MKHAYATVIGVLPLAGALVVSLSSCSSDSGTNPTTDTGAIDTGLGDGCPAPDGDSGGCICLPTFTPPPDNPGNNTILFSASGEVLALGGYAFPPATDKDPAFVDGWQVTFSRLLVTFDKIVVSANPDKVPSDQSKTDAVVAQVDGPWAIDLHKGGKLPGKGGTDEQSVPIAAVLTQNRAGGAPFDTSKRYAFGFDGIVATPTAKNVNLDAEGLCDYKDMIDNGIAVLYVGTATFKGTGCTSPTAGYDFTKLPPTVNFKLGFKSPATYINCQNPDNAGTPFTGEEHVRGVQTKASGFVIAQVTYHTDHPFWESVVHDTPAHFDQIAAHYIGAPSPTAKVEDFVGVNFTAFKDKDGKDLPWRSCLATYTAKAGIMGFDPQTVPVNPGGTPDKALRDYRDYVTYNQSTQGHLNSDGLCYVKHNYASP